MLARVGSSIVTKCIKMLDKVHGTKHPLVVTRRKMNERLGMTLNFGLNMGT